MTMNEHKKRKAKRDKERERKCRLDVNDIISIARDYYECQ